MDMKHVLILQHPIPVALLGLVFTLFLNVFMRGFFIVTRCAHGLIVGRRPKRTAGPDRNNMVNNVCELATGHATRMFFQVPGARFLPLARPIPFVLRRCARVRAM